jgi:hypothetical protein
MRGWVLSVHATHVGCGPLLEAQEASCLVVPREDQKDFLVFIRERILVYRESEKNLTPLSRCTHGCVCCLLTYVLICPREALCQMLNIRQTWMGLIDWWEKTLDKQRQNAD